MIDKRISKSDKLAALPHDRSRVLYFMIYPHLDVKGRYSGDPRDIKEDCCPRLSYSLKAITESLIELHAVGLLVLYEVDSRLYIQYTRFEDFQAGLHTDREAASKIPAYSGPTPADSGGLRTTSALRLKIKGLRFKVKDLSIGHPKTPADPLSESEIEEKFKEFWTAYPREGRLAKKESRIKFGALVKRGELEEFIKGFHGYLDYLKHQKLNENFDQRPMYAKTFVGDRWREFIGFEFNPG